MTREDRAPATQGDNVPFLRLAAGDNQLTVSGDGVEATIPATVYEHGVLFLRPTMFRRMLKTFAGEKHFTIQVTNAELLMGNVRLPLDTGDIRLFANPADAPPHWPMSEQEQQEWPTRREHGWAIDIIHKHFNTGLERICDEKFLAKRYNDYQAKHDPIYTDLLNGMEDEALAKTFVSYWTIAHTMATQSRFWLETAVAEILIEKYREDEAAAKQTYVFNMGLLGNLPPHGLADLKNNAIPVADMGEEHLEHLASHRVWRNILDAEALETIDVLVGQQERERVDERKPFQPRTWTDEQNTAARDLDAQHLAKVAQTFKGQRTSEVNLQCNLLVIEPDPLDGKSHAWAFRFINPKTISSHAQRKQERVNLLRLYALLVQEKILRDPKSISIAVAELVPRYGEFDHQDRYPDYFSLETYWTTERLWDGFIGLPFDVVTLAIRDAAKQFRERLIEGLRGLLPDELPETDAHGQKSLFAVRPNRKGGKSC